MECAYSGCNCEIPSTRRGNAKYCSSNCYRFAKKNRDRNDYFLKAKKLDRYNQNIKILEFFSKTNAPVPKKCLSSVGYDWLCYDKLFNTSSQIIFWVKDFAMTGDKILPESPDGKVKVPSFLITRR